MTTTDLIQTIREDIATDLEERILDRLVPLIEQRLKNNTLNLKDAAVYLGCCEDTLRTMARGGKIRHYRINSKYCFRQAVLDDWIAEQEAGSVASG